VQLGPMMTSRLIERVLEHDVRVLGEIDPGDDPVSPHAPEKPRFTREVAHAKEAYK